jgi:hypothetical protein
MRRSIVFIAISLAVLFCTACTSLSRSEKETVRELQDYGVREHEIVKDPGLAGALNILPGFGNFYLAYGTDEGEHWLYGFLNLLTWPLSVLWGVPEGVIDARNINKREMVYWYTHDPNGMKQMEELRAKAGRTAP